MWSAIQFRPTIASPANIIAGVGAAVQVVEVNPWTHGVAEINGHYGNLSFPNAVEALSKYLGSYTACFAIAVAAGSLHEFIGQCDGITNVFSVAEVSQWRRRAASLVRLESDKFVLQQANAKLNQSYMLGGFNTLIQLHNAATAEKGLADANGFSASDPVTNLNSFAAEKTAHDTATNQLINNVNAILAGGAGFRLYAEGNLHAALKAGMPGHEQTLTGIVLMLGNVGDFELIREVIA